MKRAGDAKGSVDLSHGGGGERDSIILPLCSVVGRESNLGDAWLRSSLGGRHPANVAYVGVPATGTRKARETGRLGFVRSAQSRRSNGERPSVIGESNEYDGAS